MQSCCIYGMFMGHLLSNKPLYDLLSCDFCGIMHVIFVITDCM